MDGMNDDILETRPTLFRKSKTKKKSELQSNGTNGLYIVERPVTTTLSRSNTKSSRHLTLQHNHNIGNNKMLRKPVESTVPSAWVLFSWAVTCCFPSALLAACSIKTRSSQQAWREKVALCWIALFLSGMVIFFLLFFNVLLCPASSLSQSIDIKASGGVVVFGTMYDSFHALPPYNTLFEQTDVALAGNDVSSQFQRPAIASCDAFKKKYAFASIQSACVADGSCLDLEKLKNQFNFLPYTKMVGNGTTTVFADATPSYEWPEVKRRHLVVVRQSVLNLIPYLIANPVRIPNDPIDAIIRKAQSLNDATHLLWRSTDVDAQLMDCLVQTYYAGRLSQLPIPCMLSRVLMILLSVVVMGIMFTRFVMAVVFKWFIAHHMTKIVPQKQQKSPKTVYDVEMAHLNHQQPVSIGAVARRQNPNVPRPAPRPTDLRTVCLVTCYSEGETALRMTLDSLAATDYDDNKKILFVIADGLVKGSGNRLTTPELLLEMMDCDEKFGKVPNAFSYVAIATGAKQHNMARVYCGSYHCEGRDVPMLLIVKCGTPAEAESAKPGNRGKRDSQLILMNFFSRVVLNDRMTPLDYDMFRKIRHITGVTPDWFELVLMVDADTRVAQDSLRLMTNAMINDSRIMGLCGETRIANKKDSFITTIQVFEYFISHHLGKAFESVFGGVTCLPGCFCMYRIKTQKHGATLPILVNPDIIEQYSTNEVYTLHQKNLLLLGEDRFLSTLMLRTFPRRRMVFVPQASCKTTVPENFKTLLSQRRRWINSTIHNLMELIFVNNLCGTFCFSMQFVVFMDLMGTAVLPASLISTYYLLVETPLSSNYKDLASYIAFSMLITGLVLPGILVVVTGHKLSYLLWMIIYLVSLPIWQIVFPLYSFWHFDDFSWGETRKVTGDDLKGHGEDEQGLFDGARIPFKRWDEYEREWRRNMLPKTQDVESRQLLNVDQVNGGFSVEDVSFSSGEIPQSYRNSYYE